MAGMRSIVIPSAAAGGLGDQAMVDVLVTEAARRFSRPPSIMPNAYAVRSSSRAIDFRQGRSRQIAGFAELARAGQVLMVGADMLDGTYGTATVLNRLRLVDMARRLGARTRIVGSSFSGAPRPEMIARLRRMSWLDILARDPVSKDRMERALDREVKLVADVAFLLEPEITCAPAERAAAWIAARRAEGRRVVALNVSGLVFKELPEGTLETYADVVAGRLARENVSVLVLPHDWRRGAAGDLASCRTLHDRLSRHLPGRCHLVEEPIAAWDAKALAGLVDAALLCRMHFAIACLGQRTPPYCLVSAGKFEGLMEHFGLAGNLFNPGELITPEAMLRPVERMLAASEDDRRTIAAALPRVLDLSRRNFDDL
jgi:polysaccharide pyruvyl transferase WcaK-like protein